MLPVSILRPPCHGPCGPRARDQARAVPVVPPRVGHKQTVCRSLAALVISFVLSRSAGISPRVLPISVLLTTPRERISPKQSSRASQLFLGPPRLATRVGRARKHERIGRGGRKRAKRRGGGGRRCPRCPALRALRHRSAPFWRKKAEAKKPLRPRLAEPRRPWATRSNLFLSALLSPRLFFTREGCAFFIATGWGRACENYRGVPEHKMRGNQETKRSLGPENVIERKSGNSASL